MKRARWRTWRQVVSALTPWNLAKGVAKDVKSGRTSIGEVGATTASVWLDLDNEKKQPDPIDEKRWAERDKFYGPGMS